MAALVATFNSLTAMYARRQIYTSAPDFRFVDGKNTQRTGHELLASMQGQSPNEDTE